MFVNVSGLRLCEHAFWSLNWALSLNWATGLWSSLICGFWLAPTSAPDLTIKINSTVGGRKSASETTLKSLYYLEFKTNRFRILSWIEQLYYQITQIHLRHFAHRPPQNKEFLIGLDEFRFQIAQLIRISNCKSFQWKLVGSSNPTSELLQALSLRSSDFAKRERLGTRLDHRCG
jgi:hypothetical protein